jgi:hypothetical protein
VKEYKEYSNHARPHQGIAQRIPCRLKQPDIPVLVKNLIRCIVLWVTAAGAVSRRMWLITEKLSTR